jgi:hypothetical protein
MRRRGLVIGVLIAVTAALSACGSSVGSNSINTTASRWLDAEVTAARSAAASGNSATALAELQRVVTDAQTLRDRHMIGASRASEIQRDAQRVIFTMNTATTTTTVPATTPQPAPPPQPGPHHKHGHQGEGGD